MMPCQQAIFCYLPLQNPASKQFFVIYYHYFLIKIFISSPRKNARKSYIKFYKNNKNLQANNYLVGFLVGYLAGKYPVT